MGGIKMNYVLIVFASFATANRVKSLLQKDFNIASDVIQTPGEIKLKSCSYSLKISRKHMDTAWNIVVKNGLSSKGVFSADNYSKIK